MSILKRLSVLALMGMFGVIGGLAASFDSGSTGAYGPMNITQDTTLDLPPDGIFHCSTITVAQGATLRFNRNPLNTPVYLLATGDVLIAGTVNVSATGQAGGPGGFDGGPGGSPLAGLEAGGYGLGPGGGSPGPGTHNYGNLLLVPLVGGSGGSGNNGGGASYGNPGGGGGGAILIASNARVLIQGRVVSEGIALGAANGSGGAIRLVAPVVGGSGYVGAAWSVGGAKGRIRIDCQDNQAYRSLTLDGVSSRGSRMIVFPAVIQALDIIEVAGNAIPVGTNAPVLFELPVDAPTNQVVKIQARNFTGDVPIRVVITPEHGPSGSFDATILQSSGNPPSVSVPVIFPAGSVCQVHAWTR